MNMPSHPTRCDETILCDGHPIRIERFGATSKAAAATATVILLHDAQGVGSGRPVRAEADALARAGFRVLLPHYLDRTRETRVGFSGIARDFHLWRAAVEAVRDHAAGASGRIALVGCSLGGALALAAAARAPDRIAALVVRSAFLPPDLGDGPLVLPPVLALHGTRDAIVGASHAGGLRDRVAAAGGTCRVHLYENQSHVFDARAEADAVARGIAYLGGWLA